MRSLAALLLALATVLPSGASAQRSRELVIATTVRRPASPFFVLSRRAGVPIDSTKLPRDAGRYYVRMARIQVYVRGVHHRRLAAERTAPNEAELRAIRARSEQEMIPLDRQTADVLPRLLASLERERARLDVHGWLALGEARFEVAARRQFDLLDAYERALERCGEQCPDAPQMDLAGAIEAFREAGVRACPGPASDPAPPCPLRAWARYHEGYAQMEMGHVDEGLAALEDASRAAEPGALRAEVQLRIGIVALEERRWEDAARALEIAVAEGDDAIRRMALSSRLLARHLAGQWLESLDAAVAVLGSPLADEPQIADANDLAAFALDAQGDFAGGTLPEDASPAIGAGILLRLGESLAERGHRREAARALAAAEARTPGAPAVAAARARLDALPAANEDANAWAARVARRCAEVAGRLPVQGTVDLRLSVDRRAGVARARARVQLDEVVAQERVSACFATPQPTPLDPRVRTARARIAFRPE